MCAPASPQMLERRARHDRRCPDQKGFSQQSSILGVLYDVVPKDHQQEVLRKAMAIEPGTTPDGVLSASYYFRFYLARALEHAGMADEYLNSIKPWRDLLALHFSTWPEVPGDTRSDSHAWTAHPIYDLLTIVAASNRQAPDSQPCASLHIWVRCPPSRLPIRIRRAPSTCSTPAPRRPEGNYHSSRHARWNLRVERQSLALKPGVNTIEAP